MRTKLLVCVLGLCIAAAVCAAKEFPEWTYWVSGGDKGLRARTYTDDEYAIGVSPGYVRDRAVEFMKNGAIEFLRIGKDVEEPEYADPELTQIGTVGEDNLWKAEYYRDEEAHKDIKGLILLIEDDDGQLRPFFFIAANKGEKLSVKVEPNAEELKRVSVVSAAAQGASHRFAFTFAKGVPRLIGESKHNR